MSYPNAHLTSLDGAKGTTRRKFGPVLFARAISIIQELKMELNCLEISMVISEIGNNETESQWDEKRNFKNAKSRFFHICQK
jgi:hypothetical protein